MGICQFQAASLCWVAKLTDNVKECEEEEGLSYRAADEIAKQIEQIKWYLWHGNAHKALQLQGDLEFDSGEPS